jgi:hypothetical protein
MKEPALDLDKRLNYDDTETTPSTIVTSQQSPSLE